MTFLLLYGKIMMTIYDHGHIILPLTCFSSLADLFLSAPAEKTEVTTTTCLSRVRALREIPIENLVDGIVEGDHCTVDGRL